MAGEFVVTLDDDLHRCSGALIVSIRAAAGGNRAGQRKGPTRV
jgi:hypothetical protein